MIDILCQFVFLMILSDLLLFFLVLGGELDLSSCLLFTLGQLGEHLISLYGHLLVVGLSE